MDLTFKKEVLAGLSLPQKRLYSKYFYNAEGDRLFQKIMHCPEYYLTNCELEILSQKSKDVLDACFEATPGLDLVELGPGDAYKSIYLLRELSKRQKELNYFPIDISSHVIDRLIATVPSQLPNCRVAGLPGEYLPMLQKVDAATSNKRTRLVLFLGSSLGNMGFDAGIIFLKEIRSMLNSGDLLLLGLDLVKEEELILNAYNDKSGFTKAFNLNLLTRINEELDGNFKLDTFSHFPVFEKRTKACKSYLISLTEQEVEVAGQKIAFGEKENILMEISQKYDLDGMNEMMLQSGFSLVQHFFDSKDWFVDTLWKA